MSEKKPDPNAKPKDRWQRKVALATNAGGTIAGPAAIWMAVNQAKRREGGMPTEAARALHSSHPGKISGKILRTLRSPAAITAGGVTAVGLQAMNTLGDATATTELMRQKRLANAQHEKASKSMDTFTDAYVSKAARGTGQGQKLDTALRRELPDDKSIDERYDAARAHDVKMGGRVGAVNGAITGGTGGAMLGVLPGSIKGSGKLMLGGAAGGALAGAATLGALARKTQRKKVNQIYDNPLVEYNTKRNMGLSDAAKRALENRRAAQEAAIGKAMTQKQQDVAAGAVAGGLAGHTALAGSLAADAPAGLKGWVFRDTFKPSTMGRMLGGEVGHSGRLVAVAPAAAGALAGGAAMAHLHNRRKAQRRKEVAKRYFNAEADRQRRLGAYAGIGAGGALALGAGAASQLEGAMVPMTDRPLPDGPGGAKRYRKAGVIRTRAGKSGKLGAALAAGSALSAVGGAAAYKRGISERNQPWT